MLNTLTISVNILYIMLPPLNVIKNKFLFGWQYERFFQNVEIIKTILVKTKRMLSCKVKPIHITETKAIMKFIHRVDFCFFFSAERDLATESMVS